MNRVSDYPPAVKALVLYFNALDKFAGQVVQCITGLSAGSNPKVQAESRISSHKSLGWGKFSKP